MRIKDIMISVSGHVSPDDSLRDAATVIKSLHLDPVPVVEDERVVGLVTQSQILATVAEGGVAGGLQTVRTVMSTDLTVCNPDDTAETFWSTVALDAQAPVGGYVPVVGRDMQLLGMVSLDTVKHTASGNTRSPHEGGDGDRSIFGNRTPTDEEDDDAQSFPASDPTSQPSSLSPERSE